MVIGEGAEKMGSEYESKVASVAEGMTDGLHSQVATPGELFQCLLGSEVVL